MNFFIGMFLQVLYLSSTTVVKPEDLEEGWIFQKFFFNFALSVIGNFDPVSIQILRRK